MLANESHRVRAMQPSGVCAFLRQLGIFQGDELGSTYGWITWKSTGRSDWCDLQEQTLPILAASANNNSQLVDRAMRWANRCSTCLLAMITVNQTNYPINRY
jgi:hypothetical protein